MNDINDQRRQLEAKRDELRERLQKIETDYRQGLDRDAEEQALQLENAEVLAEIARTTREELDRVEEQLADL